MVCVLNVHTTVSGVWTHAPQLRSCSLAAGSALLGEGFESFKPSKPLLVNLLTVAKDVVFQFFPALATMLLDPCLPVVMGPEWSRTIGQNKF